MRLGNGCHHCLCRFEMRWRDCLALAMGFIAVVDQRDPWVTIACAFVPARPMSAHRHSWIYENDGKIKWCLDCGKVVHRRRARPMGSETVKSRVQRQLQRSGAARS